MRHARRGVRVIARDHHDADARYLASLDRGRHLRADRILQADQPQEHERLLDIGG